MAKLIDLRQISGGLQLRTDVNALQASYDARKVLTDIAGGAAGNYTVDELLKALKDVTDFQFGDAVGSVAQRIQATKDDLQGKITAINTTVFKDRVKLRGTVAADGTATIPQGSVPGLDTSIKYNLYYEDNKPVQDATGANLTYDFATGLTSGIPSVVDATNVDGTVKYVPVTAPVNVKLFPIGSFQFQDLQPDFLLDNEELNLVAYNQALDMLVSDLAKDGSLIAHVEALVGSQAVQDQIKAITDAIAARVTATEARLETVQGDETVEGSIKKAVKDAADKAAADLATEAARAQAAEAKLTTDVAANKAAIETALATEVTDRTNAVANEATARQAADVAETSRAQAAEAALAQEIGANKAAGDAALAQEIIDRKAGDDALAATVEANRKASVNADADLQAEIDTINATAPVAVSVIATEGQTVFPLGIKLPNADIVRAEINGIGYKEGSHFTVDRVAGTAAWTFGLAAGGFDIEGGSEVEFFFKSTAAVAPAVHI